MALHSMNKKEVRDEKFYRNKEKCSEIFAEKIRRDWLRSSNPAEVLVDTDLKDVAVQTNSSLNIRVPNPGEEINWVWSFEVVTQGNFLLLFIIISLLN